jgi:hypothetical protein
MTYLGTYLRKDSTRTPTTEPAASLVEREISIVDHPKILELHVDRLR